MRKITQILICRGPEVGRVPEETAGKEEAIEV
jgi:hypothetical protein